MEQRPYGSVLIVRWDLNVGVTDPEVNQWDKVIAAELVEAGLEDMSCHFLSLCIPWDQDGHTWSMTR